MMKSREIYMFVVTSYKESDLPELVSYF